MLLLLLAAEVCQTWQQYCCISIRGSSSSSSCHDGQQPPGADLRSLWSHVLPQALLPLLPIVWRPYLAQICQWQQPQQGEIEVKAHCCRSDLY
jgi:hypothetical protein